MRGRRGGLVAAASGRGSLLRRNCVHLVQTHVFLHLAATGRGSGLRRNVESLVQTMVLLDLLRLDRLDDSLTGALEFNIR